MKVILVKDVEKIGKLGEVVEVSDGYARNFLIPKDLAMNSSPENMRKIDNAKLKAARAIETETKTAQEFADKLSKVSCSVGVQVGPDDKLYGSVTPADIQKALLAEGFEIDKKLVTIETPVEKLGVYHVKIKVHPQVETTVKVWVVKK